VVKINFVAVAFATTPVLLMTASDDSRLGPRNAPPPGHICARVQGRCLSQEIHAATV